MKSVEVHISCLASTKGHCRNTFDVIASPRNYAQDTGNTLGSHDTVIFSIAHLIGVKMKDAHFITRVVIGRKRGLGSMAPPATEPATRHCEPLPRFICL